MKNNVFSQKDYSYEIIITCCLLTKKRFEIIRTMQDHTMFRHQYYYENGWHEKWDHLEDNDIYFRGIYTEHILRGMMQDCITPQECKLFVENLSFDIKTLLKAIKIFKAVFMEHDYLKDLLLTERKAIRIKEK